MLVYHIDCINTLRLGLCLPLSECFVVRLS
nr:MAG TPA: hypothetical protein [Herelleviridae sp.]